MQKTGQTTAEQKTQKHKGFHILGSRTFTADARLCRLRDTTTLAARHCCNRLAQLRSGVFVSLPRRHIVTCLATCLARSQGILGSSQLSSPNRTGHIWDGIRLRLSLASWVSLASAWVGTNCIVSSMLQTAQVLQENFLSPQMFAMEKNLMPRRSKETRGDTRRYTRIHVDTRVSKCIPVHPLTCVQMYPWVYPLGGDTPRTFGCTPLYLPVSLCIPFCIAKLIRMSLSIQSCIEEKSTGQNNRQRSKKCIMFFVLPESSLELRQNRTPSLTTSSSQTAAASKSVSLPCLRNDGLRSVPVARVNPNKKM